MNSSLECCTKEKETARLDVAFDKHNIKINISLIISPGNFLCSHRCLLNLEHHNGLLVASN